MLNIVKAVLFALAMLAVAYAGRLDLVSDDIRNSLLIVLPILAVVSLRDGRGDCAACSGGK